MADIPTRGGAIFAMVGLVAVLGVAAAIFISTVAKENLASAKAGPCVEVETNAEVEARTKSTPPGSTCVVRQRTRARPFLTRIHEEPRPEDAPWRIDAYQDQMRRVEVVTACTPADQAPDSALAMLCFERDADGERIYIESTSRFSCGVKCTVAARFGDDAIVELTARSEGDRLRFTDRDRVARLITGARVVFVEAQVSVVGVQQMRFDTSNLHWPPQGIEPARAPTAGRT